jgi:uncharacterized protein (TIGR00730 family)
MNEIVITHFGSAFTSPKDDLYRKCVEIGKLLGKNDYTVCSGGYGGTMEAVSKGAKSNNGKTMGVTVESWVREPNRYIDEEIKMANLMERIMELIAIGDAYIVLPGGTGTLVEIATTLELMHKKAMKEKKIIFYTAFWKKVVETLKLDSKSLTELIDRNVFYARTPQKVLTILKTVKI